MLYIHPSTSLSLLFLLLIVFCFLAVRCALSSSRLSFRGVTPLPHPAIPGHTPSPGGRGDDDGIGQLHSSSFAGVQLSCLPICLANSSYARAQREAFALGARPPAFTAVSGGGGGGVVEAEEGGFSGRPSQEELTRGGRRAMGMERYKKEHYNPAMDEHHDLLDIPYSW